MKIAQSLTKNILRNRKMQVTKKEIATAVNRWRWRKKMWNDKDVQMEYFIQAVCSLPVCVTFRFQRAGAYTSFVEIYIVAQKREMDDDDDWWPKCVSGSLIVADNADRWHEVKWTITVVELARVECNVNVHMWSGLCAYKSLRQSYLNIVSLYVEYKKHALLNGIFKSTHICIGTFRLYKFYSHLKNL